MIDINLYTSFNKQLIVYKITLFMSHNGNVIVYKLDVVMYLFPAKLLNIYGSVSKSQIVSNFICCPKCNVLYRYIQGQPPYSHCLLFIKMTSKFDRESVI